MSSSWDSKWKFSRNKKNNNKNKSISCFKAYDSHVHFYYDQ
jgi:hypothetical protein